MQSDTSKQLLQRLKEAWSGHPPPPGASEEQLLEFEVRHQVKLPFDLKEYFKEINGSGGMDGWMIEFWPIEKVERSTGTDLPGKWFDFADYSISACVYTIRLSDNLTEANPVIGAYGAGDPVLADNFTQFMKRYLEDARSIL